MASWPSQLLCGLKKLRRINIFSVAHGMFMDQGLVKQPKGNFFPHEEHSKMFRNFGNIFAA